MNESQMIALVRQVIRQELGKVLMANMVSNQDQYRSTVQRPNESPISNLRNVQPYGFNSRAPAGMDCLSAPINNDPTHIILLGQFDDNRPAINDGEAVLYGPDGQVVYMKTDGSIRQGIMGAASPVVLGDVMEDCVTDQANAWLNAVQIGFDSFGLPVYLDPGVAESLTTIISKYVSTPSTNIVGQKNFVDRGA